MRGKRRTKYGLSSGKRDIKTAEKLSHSQNPVGFENGIGKSGQKPSFSPKSKVAFPKTEVLGKPQNRGGTSEMVAYDCVECEKFNTGRASLSGVSCRSSFSRSTGHIARNPPVFMGLGGSLGCYQGYLKGFKGPIIRELNARFSRCLYAFFTFFALNFAGLRLLFFHIILYNI
jgi:hypothetical protein